MTLDELLRKLVYNALPSSEQREAYLLLDELNNLNVFGNVQRNLDPQCEHDFTRVTETNRYGPSDRYWLCKKCHLVNRTLRKDDHVSR